MPRIKLSADDLFSSRVKEARAIVAPLRAGRPVQCDFLKSMVGGCKVLAAADSIIEGDPHRELWFRTFVQDISCQYMEFWRPLNTGDQYCLHTVMLHARALTSHEEKGLRDLVAFHSEPNVEGVDTVHHLKRRLHLHVEAAAAPMRGCHFPMDLWRLGQRPGSIKELTKLLQGAVKVLRCEVIRVYGKELFGVSEDAMADYTAW